MGIKEYLDNIKKAVKGEEVRKSIYDAIEQCYKDATGNPESISHALEEIESFKENASRDLEEFYDQVTERLQRVADQVAPKANRRELYADFGKTVSICSDVFKTIVTSTTPVEKVYFEKTIDKDGFVEGNGYFSAYIDNVINPSEYAVNGEVEVLLIRDGSNHILDGVGGTFGNSTAYGLIKFGLTRIKAGDIIRVRSSLELHEQSVERSVTAALDMNILYAPNQYTGDADFSDETILDKIDRHDQEIGDLKPKVEGLEDSISRQFESIVEISDYLGVGREETEVKVDLLSESGISKVDNTYTVPADDTNTTLFNSTMVDVGETVEFSFSMSDRNACFVELLDATNKRISVYGKLSTGTPTPPYKGDFTIPSNFSYARLVHSYASSLGERQPITRLSVDVIRTDVVIKDTGRLDSVENTLEIIVGEKHEEESLVNVARDMLNSVAFVEKNGDSYSMSATGNQTVFNSSDVSVGELITFEFVSNDRYPCFLETIGTDGSRIAFYGKGSTANPTVKYSGEFEIPSNFSYLRIKHDTSASLGEVKPITELKIIAHKQEMQTITVYKGGKISEIEKNLEGISEEIDKIGESTISFDMKTGSFLNIYGGVVNSSAMRKSEPFEAEFGDIVTIKTSNNGFTALARYVNGRYIPIIKVENNGGANINRIIELTYHVPYDEVLVACTSANQESSATVSRSTPNKIKTLELDNDVLELDYTAETKNRLANPLFTTNEREGITPFNLFSKVEQGLSGGYRIPTIIITNYGTELSATERRNNTTGDRGSISIDVRRKVNGGEWSQVQTVLSYGGLYGRFMNPSFVVDRTGVHGVVGRIFMFAGSFLNDDLWTKNTYGESNFVYIYSDDDGVTWSGINSVKSILNGNDICIPAPNNGIQTTNGTLVVPCMAYDGNTIYNCLIYKTPNESWVLSAKNIEDYQLDECCVVEAKENTVWIMAKNSDFFPNVNYPQNTIRRGQQISEYDFDSDTFFRIQSSFDFNGVCQNSVVKCGDIFLMSSIDVNAKTRHKITIWASSDCKTWIRCYRVNEPVSDGYSVVTCYGDKIVVVYEDVRNSISYQDISSLSELFKSSVAEYIAINISVQDRMMMMFEVLQKRIDELESRLG